MEWKEYECGENGISYDHAIADTPFGRFLITWKSWKDHPSFDLNESPVADHTWINGCSLDSVKAECEEIFNRAISALVSHASPGDKQ